MVESPLDRIRELSGIEPTALTLHNIMLRVSLPQAATTLPTATWCYYNGLYFFAMVDGRRKAIEVATKDILSAILKDSSESFEAFVERVSK